MEATKKLTGKSVKKWLGNNAIIVLMLLVSLFVGIIHPNFFAPANLINLFKNVSIRYIIALGISGQVQHSVGVRGAQLIVAVNRDEKAPIMSACDYGIVGDMFEIVPLLTKAINESK